jgi:hypothetical protein
MLVLSGVFNTRILDTMNYMNQDYVHVNYTLIVIYSMLLVTGSQSKNVSVPSIGQTWILVSIGAVVEMGILSTLKRLLMESTSIHKIFILQKIFFLKKFCSKMFFLA